MPDPLASLGLAQYERVVLDAMEARPCGCMVSGDPRRRARLVAPRFPPRPIGPHRAADRCAGHPPRSLDLAPRDRCQVSNLITLQAQETLKLGTGLEVVRE